jgi:hypothetical protein
MRLTRFIINHWRLIYGAGAGLCLFYAVMGLVDEPESSADTIIYTQIMLREWGLTFVIPAVAILSLGIFGYYLKRREMDERGFVMFIIPLLLALYILLFVSQPLIGDQRLFHESSVQVGGNIYNLASYHLGQLVAYECDALGIVCRVIFRQRGIVSLEYKKECLGPPRWETTEDTVSLIIQCKTLFTHHVPE